MTRHIEELATGDVTIADDKNLIIGTSGDLKVGYDEATDNRVEIRDASDTLIGYFVPTTGALSLGPDTDITHILGRCRISFGDGTTSDNAAFGHLDVTGVNAQAVRQNAAGATVHGASSGQSHLFRFGSTTNEVSISESAITLGSASTDTVTCTARFFPRQVTDAGPMTATAGTIGELVFNTSDSKFYGCTATGSPATWAAFH